MRSLHDLILFSGSFNFEAGRKMTYSFTVLFDLVIKLKSVNHKNNTQILQPVDVASL